MERVKRKISGPILKVSGVAILFKENLKVEIINSATDLNDQILKCIIQIEQQMFQLVNIYSPTKPTNKNQSYKNLPLFLEKEYNTILADNFNMIENIFLTN